MRRCRSGQTGQIIPAERLNKSKLRQVWCDEPQGNDLKTPVGLVPSQVRILLSALLFYIQLARALSLRIHCVEKVPNAVRLSALRIIVFYYYLPLLIINYTISSFLIFSYHFFEEGSKSSAPEPLFLISR